MKRKITILLAATFVSAVSFAEEISARVDAEYFLTRFYQKAYINEYKIEPSDYTSSGHEENRPVSNLFNDDWYYLWRSDSPDKEQSVTVTFDNVESVSKIIYGLQSNNPYADGNGYPQKIEVYTSESDSDDNFTYHFSLESEWSDKRLLFAFPHAVEAKRIKLVFDNIYSANGGEACAELAELMFLRDDPAFDHVVKMFADEESLTLNDRYKNDALLDSIKGLIGNHLTKSYLTERIDRAKQVLQGTLTAESFPYEVKVYQKTGPDKERYVMAFFGDKYTYFDKERYYADITPHIEKIFTYEPFSSIRDKFNIYMVFTPSNESNYYHGYNTIDSYFGTHIVDPGDGGTARLCLPSTHGIEAADKLFEEFNEKYLDEGGRLHCASLVMYTQTYGGSGYMFANNTISGPIYTTGAGPEVLVHEIGHSVADLGDEYCYIPQEKHANQTAEPNGDNSKWKEFMRFRYVTHAPLCGGYYRPSYYCIMEDEMYHSFCQVCQLGIFETVNNMVPDKADWYIANPIVNFNYNNSYPNEVKEEAIIFGNDQRLQYRTVVKNLTTENKTIVVNFKITSADGNEVRCECESQEYLVEANSLKSVTATTAELVTGLIQGDKFVATIVEKESGKVLLDHSTYKKEFGTVTTKYMIGNMDMTTNIEINSPRSIKYAAGTELTIKGLELYNYKYQKSNLIGKITVNNNSYTEVIHYYTKEKGRITLRLLDENSNEVQTIERYIGYGETFVPSQTDFPAREGYSLILPIEKVTFDGVNDMELTYMWTQKNTLVEDVKKSYSDIVVLRPNTHDGAFSLLITSNYIGDIEVSCYSTDGKILQINSAHKINESVNIPLNIGDYKGVVLINVKGGNSRGTAKVIIK